MPRPDSVIPVGDVLMPLPFVPEPRRGRLVRTEVRHVHGHEVEVHVYSSGPSGVPPPRMDLVDLQARNAQLKWERATVYTPMWELWREGYSAKGERFQ